MAKMEVLIECSSSQEHYVADGGWVVFCSDDRLSETHIEARQKLGVHIDAFATLGGIKHLASPDFLSDREFALRQFGKSQELHGSKKAVLIAHKNCGDYKKETAGMTGEEEVAFYMGELKEAKEIILGSFHDAEVVTLYVDFERAYKVEL